MDDVLKSLGAQGGTALVFGLFMVLLAYIIIPQLISYAQKRDNDAIEAGDRRHMETLAAFREGLNQNREWFADIKKDGDLRHSEIMGALRDKPNRQS